MPQDLVIGFATARDATRIAELSRDLVESGLGWTWTAPRIERCLRHRDTTVIAARSGDWLAGFAIMQLGTEHASVSLLAVADGWQRQGIGRRLMAWLDATARAAGASSMRLEVRAINGVARRFYHSLGFRETAQVPGYYRGVETAVRMSLDLRSDADRAEATRLATAAIERAARPD